jgi:hypothetical protein
VACHPFAALGTGVGTARVDDECSWTSAHSVGQKVLLLEEVFSTLTDPVQSDTRRWHGRGGHLLLAHQATLGRGKVVGRAMAHHLCPDDFVVAELGFESTLAIGASELAAFGAWVVISSTTLLVTL